MKIRDVVAPRRKGAKVRTARDHKARAIERRRVEARHAAIHRATRDRIAVDGNGQSWIIGPDPVPLI